MLTGQETVKPPKRATPLQIPAHFVRINNGGGSLVLRYTPRSRDGIELLVFAAFIATLPVVVLRKLGHEITDVSGFFALLHEYPILALIFSVAACLLLVGWYHLTNTLQVEATWLKLVCKRKTFGIVSSIEQTPAGEIIKINRRVGISGRRRRYRLLAILRDGRKIVVGRRIPKRRLAKHLQQLLQEALRLKQETPENVAG